MSHETDQIISEMMALLTVLRATINGESARFSDQTGPAPAPEPAPRMKPDIDRSKDYGTPGLMRGDHVRALWAVSTCLGSGQKPTGVRVAPMVDFHPSHTLRLLRQLREAGMLSMNGQLIVGISQKGKVLLENGTKPWQR